MRALGANGDRAIAVLNRGPVAREIRIALDDVEVAPRTNVRVRDLWTRTDVGEKQREIVITTRANSATVLGIAPQ
jgi:hypothetical protein